MCAAARCASSLSTATLAHHARASAISVSPVYGCVHVPHVSHAPIPSLADAARVRHATCASPASPRHAHPDCVGAGTLSRHTPFFVFFWRSAPFL